jgi:hypothetical protein
MNPTLEIVLKSLCCYSSLVTLIFVFALSLCKTVARADELSHSGAVYSQDVNQSSADIDEFSFVDKGPL